jgi:hypothetical protein
MVEYAIIKYLLYNKEHYIKYYNVINMKYIKDSYIDIYKLFLCINNYYTNYKDKESCSLSELEATYLSSYPMMKGSDRDNLSSILRLIEASPIDEALISYLKIHRNRSIASEVAYKALEVSEGKAAIEALDTVYAKFETVKVQEEQEFISDDLEVLYSSEVATNGLRWRLNWLNRSLGSLRKGDFGFIFARPETGKTTFLASEVTHFASQTDKPILWCNNEEGGNKVMLRCYQAALGITSKELHLDIRGNREKFHTLTGGRIKLYDDATMTARSVEKVIKQINPSLVIFDQLDKIKGFENDREDLKLGAMYQWAREIAKTYCPVIGVSQADGTGEGVKWLNMGHVANAKTAKQAEADFILGIGKSNDEGLGEVRFLNISKNKLMGDSDSDPLLRHGKGEALIKADIARYTDL